MSPIIDFTQAINFTCDYCHALPGERCYNKETLRFRVGPHPDRMQKLIDAKKNAEREALRNDDLLTKFLDPGPLTNDEHKVARLLLVTFNDAGPIMLETVNALSEIVHCPTCNAEKWHECKTSDLMSCPERYSAVCDRLKHPSANCRRDDDPNIFSTKKIAQYVVRAFIR